MADSVFHQVTINISGEVLDKLVKACPYSNDPGKAISLAITSYIDHLDRITISPETLRLIASKADMPAIQSEEELVTAVEKAGHLSPDAVVLQLDPNIMPMVYTCAEANQIPVGEQLREYFHHAFNMGWFHEVYLDSRYFNVTEEQYKRLCIELGVQKIKDGNHLFTLIIEKLRLQALTALRVPEAVPITESVADVEGLI